MKTYYFKDNENILFSYDLNTSEINLIQADKINKIKEDNSVLDIFGRDNWIIHYIFDNLNLPEILATYFAGKYIYESSGFTEYIHDEVYKDTTYHVFDKKKVENFLLKKGYSQKLIQCIIGYYTKYLPTDIFYRYMEDIEVTSENNNIVKVEFKIGKFKFVDNSRIFHNDIKGYVKYRFWGNAKLNGQPIKIEKELA